jgi:hypothetical protein
MFNDKEIASILSDFPKFELSYETMTHKKVFNHNVILAIPDGKKCLAWFTTYKSENVCFIMETTVNNGIENIYIAKTGFSDKLVLGETGTIFYGTTFRTANSAPCFCIEDLYYYKGTNYSGRTFLSRLQLLKTILQSELSQSALINNYTIFGLPLMNSDLLILLKEIELLPYRIKYLKYRWFETKKIMCAEYYKPNTRVLETRVSETRVSETNVKDTVKLNDSSVKLKESIKQLSTAVFKVTADIQSDIYNLFLNKDGKEEFYDYAFIPDYETSVIMNKLFRNIKENSNLDALEESDDEDEFENDRADKYVYLDRSFKINCKYNYKFKKWMPIFVAKENDQIIAHNLLTTKI